MQGADTGINAATERSCAAIGMEYSPGVVVTRRGASFASKVRRGAAVVALAALAAAVCVLAIEGHRGGASADSLLWVRTRRLFKTYWEAPLNSAADDYVPYEGRGTQSRYSWGTRPSHGDYAEQASYVPDDTTRHHWGTRDVHAHDDYSDDVYGRPYTPDDGRTEHYGTRVHRDYGEGDVFSRYEPPSMPYGVRPPLHVHVAGAHLHRGYPPQPGGMRNVMRQPDIHPTWSQYINQYAPAPRPYFQGPASQVIVAPPPPPPRTPPPSGDARVSHIVTVAGPGTDGEEGEQQERPVVVGRDGQSAGGHWEWRSHSTGISQSPPPPPPPPPPPHPVGVVPGQGGHWEWRGPPPKAGAFLPPTAVGGAQASSVVLPPPPRTITGAPVPRVIKYIGGATAAWPRPGSVIVHHRTVQAHRHVGAGYLHIPSAAAVASVAPAGWVESPSPFPVPSGPPGPPGQPGAVGYRDTYVIQGPPGAPGRPGRPGVNIPGGVIVGAQGTPGADGRDGATVDRYFARQNQAKGGGDDVDDVEPEAEGGGSTVGAGAGWGQRVTGGISWGYSPSEQTHWASLSSDWKACGDASNQSPIDISPGGAESSTLEGTGPEWIFPVDKAIGTLEPLRSSVTSGGAAWGVTVGWGKAVKWQGDEYDVVEIVPHTPSEHTIDGGHADLELQVMLATGGGQKLAISLMYSSEEASEAAQDDEAAGGGSDGGVSQLLALITGGEAGSSQRASKGLIRLVTSALAQGSQQQALAEDAGGSQQTGWYKYEGSLTTPPCTEGVTWLVARAVRSVSRDQVAALVSVLGMSDRNVQPLGDRVVSVFD